MRSKFILLIVVLILFLCLGCGNRDLFWSFEVQALSSALGVPVEGATVYYQKNPQRYWGSVLWEEPLPISEDRTNAYGIWNGNKFLPGETYSILLKKEGHSSSLIQNLFIYEGMPPVKFILSPNPILTEDNTPPAFTEFDLIGASNYSGNVSFAMIHYGKVALLTPSCRMNIEVTGKTPSIDRSDAFGIGMMIDDYPTMLDYYPSLAQNNDDDITKQNNHGFWVTKAYFEFDELVPAQSPRDIHFLSFVAYDRSNNRVERRISFRTNKKLEGLGIPNPPTVKKIEMLNFANDRGLFTQEKRNTSQCTVVTIAGDGDYSGFELYRSDENRENYKLVKIKQLELNEPPADFYEIVDDSSDLREGVSYYYSLRAFKNKQYSMYVDLEALSLLPQLEIELEHPVNCDFYPYGEDEENNRNPAFIYKIKNEDAYSKKWSLGIIFAFRLRSVDGMVDFAHGSGDSKFIPYFYTRDFFSKRYLIKGTEESDIVSLINKGGFSYHDEEVDIILDYLRDQADINFAPGELKALKENTVYQWSIEGKSEHGIETFLSEEFEVNGYKYEARSTSYSSPTQTVSFTVKESTND